MSREKILQKVPCDYHELHQIKKRLMDGKRSFSKLEASVILELFKAAEGTLFPDEKELQRHHEWCKVHEKIDPEADPDRWKALYDLIGEFESTFLKK